MKNLNCVSLVSDPKSKLGFCKLFIAATLICGVYFIASALVAKDYKEGLLRWETIDTMQKAQSRKTESNICYCKNRCRPPGSEVLPEGIVVKSSNLEMRPLWDSDVNNNNLKPSMNLLAMAVGIKQKVVVNQIVQKDFAWSDSVMHVSGGTKQKGGLPNVSYIQT